MSHRFRRYGRQTVVAMTRPRSGERSYDSNPGLAMERLTYVQIILCRVRDVLRLRRRSATHLSQVAGEPL